MNSFRLILQPIFKSSRNISLLRQIRRQTIVSVSWTFPRNHELLKVTSANIKKNNHGKTFQKRFYADSALPPHIKVALPALSPTMELGTIISWSKQEGDQLAEGDLLAEIETDKATMGFETPEEGYLAKIIVPAGAKDVKVGNLLCIIVSEQSMIDAFKNYSEDSVEASNTDVTTANDAPVSTETNISYPEHYPVNLPALSPTMESGTLQAWMKNIGDEISDGDVLAQIETDKAVMEFEAPEVGYLAKILIEGGTKDIKVGKLLCIIVDSKDKIDAFKDFTSSAGAQQIMEKPKSEKISVAPISEAPIMRPVEKIQEPKKIVPRQSGDRVFVSPFARKLANEKNIDFSTVQGTGPNNRVVANDILNYKPSEKVTSTSYAPIATDGEFVDIELNNIRKVIAKRLVESKTTIPHYYLSRTMILDDLLKARIEINQQLEATKEKISVNDLIIKAVAFACKKVPQANSAWYDTYIRQHNRVDVSVAVATENGLITPIIFGACQKSVLNIARDVKELAKRAKENKLKPNEFQGGTFTVSNLGMFGVSNFSAIINPPQSCILAVGASKKAVIPDEKNGYRTVEQMQVTLSCDHRVVDGAVGAQWLEAFTKAIEKPALLLI